MFMCVVFRHSPQEVTYLSVLHRLFLHFFLRLFDLFCFQQIKVDRFQPYPQTSIDHIFDFLVNQDKEFAFQLTAAENSFVKVNLPWVRLL